MPQLSELVVSESDEYIKIEDLLSKWADLNKTQSNKYAICYSYKNNIFSCEMIYFAGDNIDYEKILYEREHKSVIFLSSVLDGAVNHIVLFPVFEEIMSDVGIMFEKIIDIRKDSVIYRPLHV